MVQALDALRPVDGRAVTGPWSEAECAELLRRHDRGDDTRDIAQGLNRVYQGTAARLAQLLKKRAADAARSVTTAQIVDPVASPASAAPPPEAAPARPREVIPVLKFTHAPKSDRPLGANAARPALPTARGRIGDDGEIACACVPSRKMASAPGALTQRGPFDMTKAEIITILRGLPLDEWTASDDLALVSGVIAGRSIADIAETLGVTEKQAEARLEVLLPRRTQRGLRVLREVLRARVEIS